MQQAKIHHSHQLQSIEETTSNRLTEMEKEIQQLREDKEKLQNEKKQVEVCSKLDIIGGVFHAEGNIHAVYITLKLVVVFKCYSFIGST